jgi:hypothetical protein
MMGSVTEILGGQMNANQINDDWKVFVDPGNPESTVWLGFSYTQLVYIQNSHVHFIRAADDNFAAGLSLDQSVQSERAKFLQKGWVDKGNHVFTFSKVWMRSLMNAQAHFSSLDDTVDVRTTGSWLQPGIGTLDDAKSCVQSRVSSTITQWHGLESYLSFLQRAWHFQVIQVHLEKLPASYFVGRVLYGRQSTPDLPQANDLQLRAEQYAALCGEAVCSIADEFQGLAHCLIGVSSGAVYVVEENQVRVRYENFSDFLQQWWLEETSEKVMHGVHWCVKNAQMQPQDIPLPASSISSAPLVTASRGNWQVWTIVSVLGLFLLAMALFIVIIIWRGHHNAGVSSSHLLVGGVNASGQVYQADGTLVDAPIQDAWIEEAMRTNTAKENTPQTQEQDALDAQNADEHQNAPNKNEANAVK